MAIPFLEGSLPPQRAGAGGLGFRPLPSQTSPLPDMVPGLSDITSSSPVMGFRPLRMADGGEPDGPDGPDIYFEFVV